LAVPEASCLFLQILSRTSALIHPNLGTGKKKSLLSGSLKCCPNHLFLKEPWLNQHLILAGNGILPSNLPPEFQIKHLFFRKKAMNWPGLIMRVMQREN